MTIRDLASRIASIASLAEPVRRSLYLYVAAQPEPVSRDQAAAALGVARHVAKFNLDKLEEESLLEAFYARPQGRSGPGAGRPAKLYRRSSREVAVSLPERHYDLAARVMAKAIIAAQDGSVPIADALSAAAREAGQALGETAKAEAIIAAAREAAQAPGGTAKAKAGTEPSLTDSLRAVRDVLTGQGYEPREADQAIALANCPFHELAQTYTELVCKINLDLVSSMLTAAAPHDARAEFRPTPGQCCVRIAI